MTDNSIMNSDVSACTVSEKFNSVDADVVFRSSDDVLLKIHRRNLESNASGFAPSGFETLDEIVPLTESSSTLELLFQYIYPVPQPDIASFPFETTADLAEAAEKYQVYPAMYVCKLVMGMGLLANAPKVFAYAGRHGYNDLLTKAAPHLIGTPLHKVALEIPGHLIVPWIKYNSAWEDLLQKARLYPYTNADARCSGLSNCHHFGIISHMAKLENVKALDNLTAVFGNFRKSNKEDGNELPTYLREWRAAIESDLKNMKSFDAYLEPKAA